jgi:hypothetical protein
MTAPILWFHINSYEIINGMLLFLCLTKEGSR